MITLKRIKQTEDGTFGVLLWHDGTEICKTLEEPWRNNAPNVSCIPCGEYKCVPHKGLLVKRGWLVKGVPNRVGVLIHCGNTIADTEGCILVGLDHFEKGVLRSRLAMDKLHKQLPGIFTLKVTNG